jgi:hypothetical protein
MIRIDDVYQKVLAIANKEQRGYITPQEFNLFADHAQMEIFEQYFYDLDQFQRIPGNNITYSDRVTNVENKISYFKRYDVDMSDVISSNGDVEFDQNSYKGDKIYKITAIRLRYAPEESLYVAEEMQLGSEFFLYGSSPLAKHTKKRPVYWKRTLDDIGLQLRIYPKINTSATVVMTYIRKPKKPNWTYVVSPGSHTALYDASAGNGQNFELHPSEETELVYKILKLAGISMIRDDIMRAGQGLETSQVQQEKQ